MSEEAIIKEKWLIELFRALLGYQEPNPSKTPIAVFILMVIQSSIHLCSLETLTAVGTFNYGGDPKPILRHPTHARPGDSRPGSRAEWFPEIRLARIFPRLRKLQRMAGLERLGQYL